LPVQTLDVYGVDVAYVDSGGDGEPIVFVHGLSSSMAYWERQIPAFAANHRVIALDLPGYGASARPDAAFTPPWYAHLLAGFLRELGVRKATVVGHSMGGQVAMTLALEQPALVSRLVLSAPAGFERFDAGEAAFMKGYWHEARALESTETEIRASFTQAVFNTHDADVEKLIEERVRMGRHPDFRGTSVAVSRSIAGMLDFPVADRLGEIVAPTLIVFGTDDKMIPNPAFTGGQTRTIAEIGHRGIPGSELVMIRGAGHTVHFDAPDVWNRAVMDWIDRAPAAWGDR
jgi:pimeloyl-ACP methyl ester carboxylesterase